MPPVRSRVATLLATGILTTLSHPVGSLLPSRTLPWQAAWACSMPLPSAAFMLIGDDLPGPAAGGRKRLATSPPPASKVNPALFSPLRGNTAGGRAAGLSAARGVVGGLTARAASGSSSAADGAQAGGGGGEGAPVKTEEAEAELEALEFPPNLDGWVDRLPQDLLAAIDIIENEGGGACWLVGGCVRDCLSGLVPWEVDMASTLHPQKLLELFPRALDTGSQYGTVTIRKGGVSVECTTLRTDAQYSDGRRPDRVDFGTSLKEDLARRDFTINAMAVNVRQRKLFDPYGGREDVEKAVLRAVGSAEVRLREDGLRCMRGYRFLDGKTGERRPDQELSEALKMAPQLLTKVSRERVWAELRRILSGPRASMVLDRMAQDHVLASILDPSVVPGCRGLRAMAGLRPDQLPLWGGAEFLGTDNAHDFAEKGVIGSEERVAGLENGREDPLRHPKAPKKPQAYTHLAVMDLEATCDDRRGFSPQEVIELPLVLISVATGKVVGEFRTFVKPTVHPVLTDFCRALTGIEQADVDSAPEFPQALRMAEEWLEAQGVRGEGVSLLFVTDGDWDLRSMMPKQCAMSEVEMPEYMQRWADVRALFVEAVNAETPAGLVLMCQALQLQFQGKAHSGIDDSRNIARVALTLLQDFEIVFKTTSAVKGIKNDETHVLMQGSQQTHEERTLRTVCARLALILALIPPDRAESSLKGLKLSKDEIRQFQTFVKYLGHMPRADNPGQLRRYRAVLGPTMVPLQLRLEAAWAASEEDAETREAMVKNVEQVTEALKQLPPLRAVNGSHPMVTGKWLMESAGAKPGPLLGKIKDYLHYMQVDQDLEDIDAVARVCKDELQAMEHMDKRAYEVHVNAMPRLVWPPI